jgi:acetylglutamate kinase
VIIVIKIGGAAVEDAGVLRKCARAIAELAQDGHRVAVVHGGGAALTRMLKQLGKQSEFVGGLRVTDAETRDVALMVLGGMINKKLVAAIQAAGWNVVPGATETCPRERSGIRGRDLLRGALLDRGVVAAGRNTGAGIARIGRGRRVLQRQRR